MAALVHGKPRIERFYLIALVAIAFLLGLALLAEQLAHAELVGSPARVTEAGCDMTVEIEGPIARVTETHRLVSSSTTPTVALYAAALARGAVVDSFSVTLAGREEPGVLVPVESLANHTPTSLGLAPDPGSLRVYLHEEHPVIEARLFPVSPSSVTAFTIRWSAPPTYKDGQMTLVLPARGRGDNLGRCAVHLAARPAAGIKGWASVRAGGVWIGAGARVRGVVPGAAATDAFTLEARPQWIGPSPVLAVAHAPDGSSVASTVAIYVPDVATRARFAPARLLFVIDNSRSMGADARRSTVALIETLVRAAPSGTPVEGILFDRRARRVLGSWQAGDAGGLARLTRAVQDAPTSSGTDLATALTLAATTLSGEAGHVVVITDGVLPTTQSGTELLGHFAAPAGKVAVDVLIPLAPGAATPERGALETLAHVYGGRVAAFPTERAMPAAVLTEGMATGLPIDELEVSADGHAVEGLSLPEVLAAGSGVVLTATLPRRPARLVLRARRGNHPVEAKAVGLPAIAARLAIASRVDENVDTHEGVTLARRHGVLGSTTAFVALDGRVAGVTARREAARRTGALTYTPPPATPEASKVVAPAHVVTTSRVSAAGELPRSSVQLALRDQLVPQLRACYRDALRAAPALAGDLIVELEIARTEVMAVNFGGDHFPEAMISCAADAAFSMTTPAYALGDTTDTVFVIRKPIKFRAPASSTEEPTVSLDDVLYPATNPAGRPAVEVEADTPL